GPTVHHAKRRTSVQVFGGGVALRRLPRSKGGRLLLGAAQQRGERGAMRMAEGPLGAQLAGRAASAPQGTQRPRQSGDTAGYGGDDRHGEVSRRRAPRRLQGVAAHDSRKAKESTLTWVSERRQALH